MRIYCSTFEGGTPDWLSIAGNWEQMDAYATCNRPYIIMETGEYSQILAASQGSTGSTVQPSFPLASLTLEQAEQLGWLSLAPILTAYLARKFRDVLN